MHGFQDGWDAAGHDPDVPWHIRRNREFILAVVTRAAAGGVARFLDLGAGLPASPAVQQAAWKVSLGARVCYVDDTRRRSWPTRRWVS